MKRFITASACLLLLACGQDESAKIEERVRADRQASAARFEKWAYVAKEKEIAPGETLRLVIIPHPEGWDFFDTRCLIHTNTVLKTSSMVCPDADKSDLEESGNPE